MITSKLENKPKSTVEITITISNDEIKKAYETVMDSVVKNSELKGFRKGMAPRNLVEQSVDKEKVYQQAFQQLLPKAYYDAIKEHNLTPIVDPQISLISPEKLSEIENGGEVVFKAATATKPQINLKNYKEEIKKLKAKASIWTPDKGNPQGDEKEKQGPGFEEIINVLLTNTEAEISDLLSGNEANRLLSQTLDEIKKLGLTLDQYLASSKKTAEDLRADAVKKAAVDLKLEFVLQEIAKEEKITVANEEIEKVIMENNDPKAQENLRKQSYMIAAILLQQKTLDYLKNL